MEKYTKSTWEDRIVQYPNRYKDQNGNIITLTEEPGNVAKQGTLVSAEKMNNIENGIDNLYDTIIQTYTLTLLAANWTKNTTTNYYEYNVSNTNITADTLVNVYADIVNQEKLSSGYVESYNGGFKIIVSEEVVENIDVTITYQITSTESTGDEV